MSAVTEVNVFAAAQEYDADDPAGYRAGVTPVGRAAGGREETVKVFELPLGQSGSPYHYEYVEEWVLVLEGDVTLRTPEGERPLTRGDLVCFAPGPAGAHKLTGVGADAARVMLWSSAREPAVAVYPDSDKIGVWPGDSADKLMLRRADGAVDYWDGERGR